MKYRALKSTDGLGGRFGAEIELYSGNSLRRAITAARRYESSDGQSAVVAREDGSTLVVNSHVYASRNGARAWDAL